MAKKGKYEKTRTSAAKRAVNKGSVRTAKKGTGVAARSVGRDQSYWDADRDGQFGCCRGGEHG